MFKNAEQVSDALRALSHPLRLKLLCLLQEGEKTVGDLFEKCEASQSAVSQYLARLKSEGMVECRKEGAFAYYRIVDPKLQKMMNALKKIYCET